MLRIIANAQRVKDNKQRYPVSYTNYASPYDSIFDITNKFRNFMDELYEETFNQITFIITNGTWDEEEERFYEGTDNVIMIQTNKKPKIYGRPYDLEDIKAKYK